MAIGCGPKISKFILFTFNVLFWLSGLSLIVIGSVYLANGTMSYIDTVVDSNTNRNTLIGLVVLGVIIFIIGFCGCCGAIKESRCLLGAYIVLLVLIILAEVAVGIIAAVMKGRIQEEIETKLSKAINTTYVEGAKKDKTLNFAIDEIQRGFKCCGINSSKDWGKSEWYKSQTDPKKDYPMSCCSKDDEKTCGVAGDKHFTIGCVSQMELFIKKYFPIIIGVLLGIAFFEIFVVICAVCLCRNTDDQRQQV